MRIYTKKFSEKSYSVFLYKPRISFVLFIFEGGPDMTPIGGMKPLCSCHLGIKIKNGKLFVVKNRYGIDNMYISENTLFRNINRVTNNNEQYIVEVKKVLEHFGFDRLKPKNKLENQPKLF